MIYILCKLMFSLIVGVTTLLNETGSEYCKRVSKTIAESVKKLMTNMTLLCNKEMYVKESMPCHGCTCTQGPWAQVTHLSLTLHSTRSCEIAHHTARGKCRLI